ncbi:metal-dependent hydrolase [Croceicoccus sp. Ery15]|uniref:metal-dependent hydrolase n=1 Tax=Croceicoccus sp. Ery15 TaxID=1703338 RepID=UPI001E291202|nr:metal-dependent hydrolase [Croceicoccus sp. Ery15]
MDNLTHGLVGALIGQAGLKRRTGLAMPALIFGANLPDIDAGCVVWGTESLAMRRGLTHGPIALVLLPLALAGFLWWFDRWQARRGTRPDTRLPVHFGWLFALAFLACLTHPALDWMNVYGIRLLEPFSHRWFHGDILFIIDVWLWAMMGLGLILSLLREKRRGNWRTPARAAIAGALAYIGVNAGITAKNEADGALYAQMREMTKSEVIALPLPIEFWRRDLVVGGNGAWFKKEAIGPDDALLAPISDHICKFPDPRIGSANRPDVAAFLFWSQAPFALRNPDGGVTIHDARFFDERTRGQFSVYLPDTPCIPLR